jgi:anaerobic selenocysteine-containing dehydrogenase
VLHELHPNGVVEMHPSDAAKLGLVEKDIIVLTSKRGKLELQLDD